MEGDDEGAKDYYLQLAGDALYLNYRQLQSLPQELFDADVRGGLQRLYAKHNLLKSLPPDIKMLQNLTELYLHSNGLKTLPEELGELTNLELLGLSENELTSLPASICRLHNLKRLQLARNQLTQLPAGIGELGQLRSLEVSHNGLRTLPSQLSACVSLQELCVDSNQLVTLPRQLCCLPRLSSISACGNQLLTLPQDLGRIPTLQAVYVDNNPLLTALPASIFDKTTGFYGSGTGAIPEQAMRMHKHISVLSRQGRETTILMPAEIRSLGQRNTDCVPPLLELTLRKVSKYQKSSVLSLQEEEVPGNLTALLRTPTAHCRHCDCPVFLSAFAIVFWEQGQPCTLGFCCSSACVRQCFLTIRMPFLHPCMEDMALVLVPR